MSNFINACVARIRDAFASEQETKRKRSEARRKFSGASRCVWKMDSEA